MSEKLLFRRQFILAKAPLAPLADWKSLQVGGYYLYTHPDISVTQVVEPGMELVLIGSLFDPAEPEKDNATILKDIHSGTHSIEDLFLQIKGYAGRYALFYNDGKDVIIFHDALALREIYYCTKDNQVVCGSQPNIMIKYACPEIAPSRDLDFMEFYTRNSKGTKWNPYRKWIGDDTYYDGVKHLLPNHYLDISKREARRYWPTEPIKRLELKEAVSRGCAFLQGSIRAIMHRHQIMMAVTSGKDSRTLLAASREYKDKIYYFINDQELGPNHPDVSVPRNIFESAGVPFHVHDVAKHVDDEFRRIFLGNTFFSSERILPTIYNVYYRNLSEKVNILGIGEIGRTRFGKEPKQLNGYRMAYKLGHKEGCYVMRQGEQILAELLPVARACGLNALTLLYWEHYLGNWGATGNSESDIAIEELDPYDSHMLYEIFLGVDDKYTNYRNPVIFKEMIHSMWPELLNWPFNPPYTFQDKIVDYMKGMGIYSLLKELKYQAYYLRYRCQFPQSKPDYGK